MMNGYREVYQTVSSIPSGRVATYGQIAELSGIPGRARLVGYLLSSLPDNISIPWHRVVNAKGCISPRSDGSDSHEIQRLRLEHEGVEFDEAGRIPLDCFQWRPGT